MRKKYSPKELEVLGNVLRKYDSAESPICVAEPPHTLACGQASFEDLLALRFALERKRAQLHGLRSLPSPQHQMDRYTATPPADPRYGELSLSLVRDNWRRRQLLDQLSVQ